MRKSMSMYAAVLMVCLARPGVCLIDRGSVVAMWLFDEGQGGDVHDSSGNGHHGAIEGNVGWVDGRFGSAIELFGDGGVVVIRELGLAAPESEVTITLWMIFHGTPPRDVLRFDPDVGNNRILLQFPGTAPVVQYGPPQHQVTTVVPKAIGEEWVFLAFAGSARDKTMRMFVNGEQTVNFNGDDNNQPAFVQSPQDWNIGGQRGQSFEGLIDELAVFDQSLSEADILSLMNGLHLAVLAVEPRGKLATVWGSLKEPDRDHPR